MWYYILWQFDAPSNAYFGLSMLSMSYILSYIIEINDEEVYIIKKLTYEAKPSMLMISEIRGEAGDFMFDYGQFWIFNWYLTTNETNVKVFKQHLKLN